LILPVSGALSEVAPAPCAALVEVVVLAAALVEVVVLAAALVEVVVLAAAPLGIVALATTLAGTGRLGTGRARCVPGGMAVTEAADGGTFIASWGTSTAAVDLRDWAVNACNAAG
jgi:hypothetical protein